MAASNDVPSELLSRKLDRCPLSPCHHARVRTKHAAHASDREPAQPFAPLCCPRRYPSPPGSYHLGIDAGSRISLNSSCPPAHSSCLKVGHMGLDVTGCAAEAVEGGLGPRLSRIGRPKPPHPHSSPYRCFPITRLQQLCFLDAKAPQAPSRAPVHHSVIMSPCCSNCPRVVC